MALNFKLQDLEKAVKDGTLVIPEANDDSFLGQVADTAGAFTRGVAQDLTLGFSDEMTALGESALTGKPYEQSVAESRKNYETAQQESPWAYGTGEWLGTLGSVVGTGGASALKAIGTPIAKTLGKKMYKESAETGLKSASKDIIEKEATENLTKQGITPSIKNIQSESDKIVSGIAQSGKPSETIASKFAKTKGIDSGEKELLKESMDLMVGAPPRNPLTNQDWYKNVIIRPALHGSGYGAVAGYGYNEDPASIERDVIVGGTGGAIAGSAFGLLGRAMSKIGPELYQYPMARKIMDSYRLAKETPDLRISGEDALRVIRDDVKKTLKDDVVKKMDNVAEEVGNRRNELLSDIKKDKIDASSVVSKFQKAAETTSKGSSGQSYVEDFNKFIKGPRVVRETEQEARESAEIKAADLLNQKLQLEAIKRNAKSIAAKHKVNEAVFIDDVNKRIQSVQNVIGEFKKFDTDMDGDLIQAWARSSTSGRNNTNFIKTFRANPLIVSEKFIDSINNTLFVKTNDGKRISVKIPYNFFKKRRFAPLDLTRLSLSEIDTLKRRANAAAESLKNSDSKEMSKPFYDLYFDLKNEVANRLKQKVAQTDPVRAQQIVNDLKHIDETYKNIYDISDLYLKAPDVNAETKNELLLSDLTRNILGLRETDDYFDTRERLDMFVDLYKKMLDESAQVSGINPNINTGKEVEQKLDRLLGRASVAEYSTTQPIQTASTKSTSLIGGAGILSAHGAERLGRSQSSGAGMVLSKTLMGLPSEGIRQLSKVVPDEALSAKLRQIAGIQDEHRKKIAMYALLQNPAVRSTLGEWAGDLVVEEE